MDPLVFNDLNKEQQDRVRGVQDALGGRRQINVQDKRQQIGKSSDGWEYFPMLDQQGRLVLDQNGQPAAVLRREDTPGAKLGALFGRAPVQVFQNGQWVDLPNGQQQVTAVQRIFDQYGGRQDAYLRAVEDMRRRGLYDQQTQKPMETANLGG